jgi:hypothetical protein
MEGKACLALSPDGQRIVCADMKDNYLISTSGGGSDLFA